MRKALTLIELILSMVIIGVVFTVIPKLIISLNQSAQVTLKEEAMFNAVAMMGMIISLPWDENNTVNSQILDVTDGDISYDCNTTSGYRIGGFVGGRNCIEPIGVDYNATSIGKEDENYTDIDDYNGNITTTKSPCSSNLYDLNTTVTYVGDYNTPYTSGTTNTKMIHVKVDYNDSKHSGCITDLNYTAYNIGQIQINSRSW